MRVYLLFLSLAAGVYSCGAGQHPDEQPVNEFTSFAATLLMSGQGPGSCNYEMNFTQSLNVTVQKTCSALDQNTPASQSQYTTSISKETLQTASSNLILLNSTVIADRYSSTSPDAADSSVYYVVFTSTSGQTKSTYIESNSETALPEPLRNIYALLKNKQIHP